MPVGTVHVDAVWICARWSDRYVLFTYYFTIKAAI